MMTFLLLLLLLLDLRRCFRRKGLRPEFPNQTLLKQIGPDIPTALERAKF
jgi:hypothetical protein